MNLADDLDIFFADFGESTTVFVDGHAAGRVTFLWEQPARTFNPLTGGIETTEPGAVVKTADLEALGVGHGARFSHADVAWYVIGMEADGQGFTRLRLSQDSDQ